ncbi:MAG: hypothetical protein K9G58_14630 [Bacteroidales bacterium]|nr:hypothetical protein [Bacteroidales bacterium]MCF8386477.1 hypothetical protein [Bacteroidales bacterium]MCF8399407.1 hypothetical protein [Bacteroidales bacterium]
MKKVLYSIIVLGMIAFMSSCNTNSKADSWSAEQEKEWKSNCKELLMDNGEDKATAEDYCDCMFKKTAEAYTPEEAAKLTTKQEQEIWDKCDYSW